MKQFIVIGLGSFGYNLAESLAGLGHEVLAIDQEERKIESIKGNVTHAVCADATDRKILEKFVSRDADAVIIGLDEGMESSTLVALYLKDMGMENVIVKALSDDHAKILKAIGATEIIYPEKDVAIRLAERLSTPNLIEHLPLTPEYSIVEITPPERFIGKTLRELELRKKYGFIVIAVKDILTDTFYLIPGADFKIRENVALMIMGKKKDIDRLEL